MASSTSTSAPSTFKRDTSGSAHFSPIAPTKNKDSQTTIYEPYVNHAACLKHHHWWREPHIVWGGVLALTLALSGLFGAFWFTIQREASPTQVKPFAFAPFANEQQVSQESTFCQLFQQAEDLARSGDSQAALKAVQKADTITGVNNTVKAAMCNDLAIAMHCGGDESGAILYLKKAITLDPHLLVAHNNLAMVMMARGERYKAADVLQDASKLHPFNSGLTNRLNRLRNTI